jgi:hypothetical protein
MIENLYDDVLSLLNESGYLDYVEINKSLLQHKNKITKNNLEINYSIVIFSHDTSDFRIPFKYITKNGDIYLHYGNNRTQRKSFNP